MLGLSPPGALTRATHARARAPQAWLRFATPTLLGVLMLVSLLAGCGSSDNGVAAKPAAEILAATRTAAQNASSVHLIASSKITKGPSLTLNANLAKTGGHARVSVLGMNIEVIRTGDTLYVKGDKTFARRLGSVLHTKIPANTWLKGPVKGLLAQTAPFASITTELPLVLGGGGEVTKGARTKLNGQPAIAIKQEHKLYTGTLYVATTGQPYPLKPAKSGGQETGQTTFTEWTQHLTINPPPNAIDITQLQRTSKAH
jgi:hypothetical protein